MMERDSKNHTPTLDIEPKKSPIIELMIGDFYYLVLYIINIFSCIISIVLDCEFVLYMIYLHCIIKQKAGCVPILKPSST